MTPEERKPRYYGRPVNFRPSKVHDFEVCYGAGGLAQSLRYINDCGYEIISVTQNGTEYTVVFRRPAP